jgi:predicted nucleic acid-binding protein
MEVLAGATPKVEAATRSFLEGFEIVALDGPIAECAVMLRKANKIKLPDVINQAPAQANAGLLVTRNTRDFSSSDPGVRVPYVI